MQTEIFHLIKNLHIIEAYKMKLNFMDISVYDMIQYHLF